jgi:hypothetical protein
MWRLLREGLRVYLPALLISWTIGTVVFLLVVAVLALFGSVQERADLARVAAQIGLPILIASMISGFIVTGTERSESRVRMHTMLPVPLTQVALARVLLPTALLLMGLVVAHALFAVMLAIEGHHPLSSRHLTVDFVGVQLLFWVLGALAVREVIELRQRARWSRVLGSLAILVVAVVILVVAQLGPMATMGWRVALTGTTDVILVVFAVVLFRRRTSFVR